MSLGTTRVRPFPAIVITTSMATSCRYGLSRAKSPAPGRPLCAPVGFGLIKAKCDQFDEEQFFAGIPAGVKVQIPHRGSSHDVQSGLETGDGFGRSDCLVRANPAG